MEQFIGGENIVRKSFKDSTSIAFASYNKLHMWLEVTFKNGSIYRYKGIPEEQVNELFSASSTGKHFQNYVKNAGYSYERIK